jgi:hypothetical protein
MFTADNSSATGVFNNLAFADNSSAVGVGNNLFDATNSGAVGEDNILVGATNSFAVGDPNNLAFSFSSATVGDDNSMIKAKDSLTVGKKNKFDGAVASLGVGTFNSGEYATDSIVVGSKSSVSGATSSAAFGTGADASGSNNSFAFGNGASVADTTNSFAAGASATVTVDDGNAIGTKAKVTHARSTAIGYGAQSEFVDEVSLGNKNGSQTVTMPGITSDKSVSRQTGPLEVVTSDDNGHVATDGGSIFSALSELNGGVAIAMALVNPDFVASEKFGISGNVSYWEENVALGFTAAGVLGRNLFGSGERITVSGGVGFSVEEQSFGRQGSNSSVGGRGGVQLTW